MVREESSEFRTEFRVRAALLSAVSLAEGGPWPVVREVSSEF